MNETGSYPGQPWLWLYQMWYHIKPFRDSASVDIWAIYLTSIGTLLLVLVPFIPGLRDIPRYVPLYRLVWRSWYRSPSSAATAGGPGVPVGPEGGHDGAAKHARGTGASATGTMPGAQATDGGAADGQSAPQVPGRKQPST